MRYGLQNPEEKGVIPGEHWTTAQQILERILRMANKSPEDGCGAWLTVVYQDGVTRELADQVNELMSSLTCNAVAKLDEHGQLTWNIEFEEFEGLAARLLENAVAEAEDVKEMGPTFRVLRDNPELANGSHQHHAKLRRWILASYAYGFAYLLNDGVLWNLRRCQRPECRKFYIAGPRSKWCSENCGGIVRTKAKRKRDQQRGF